MMIHHIWNSDILYDFVTSNFLSSICSFVMFFKMIISSVNKRVFWLVSTTYKEQQHLEEKSGLNLTPTFGRAALKKHTTPRVGP
jgi:hypothetical protein